MTDKLDAIYGAYAGGGKYEALSDEALLWTAEIKIAALIEQRDLLLAVVKQLVEIGELATKEYDRWEPQAHLFSMVERLQNLDDEARAAIALAATGDE